MMDSFSWAFSFPELLVFIAPRTFREFLEQVCPFLVKPRINDATYFPKSYHEIHSVQLYSCSATGDPPHTVTWYEGPTSAKNARGTGTGKAEVTIKPGKEDSAQYTCIAENEAGDVKKKMALMVACKYTSFIKV